MNKKLLSVLISSTLTLTAYPAMTLANEVVIPQQNEQAQVETLVNTLNDMSVELVWQETSNATYEIELLKVTEGESSISTTYQATSSGFYINQLDADSHYEVTIKTCVESVCQSTQTGVFNTPASVVSFDDSRRKENHLSGGLAAHINFAQTHTSVMPYGNDEKGYPNLVMDRNALLLVTPKIKNVHQLWVEVLHDDIVVDQFKMSPPSAQPITDQPNNGRERVIFSHYAWSTQLNWELMKPGMSLRLVDNNSREGILTADMIKFGGAPELVVQNIDIGFLKAEPRNRYQMIDRMAQHTADYYQKIPVSKLIMADYTPLHLTKITLPNGKVYTEKSESNGSVYAGDMRGDIGKALVSQGINNANIGLSDTAGNSPKYTRHFNHATAHNSRGEYANGFFTHGLSGGAGMATIMFSNGDEWSHELAHIFNRTHNPSQANIHSLETGWGWDAYLQRFIGNLHWTSPAETVTAGDEVRPPFKDLFRYMRDTMADGEVGAGGSMVSYYNLEHPKGARRAQNWLNDSHNLNLSTQSGFVRWDEASQAYLEADVDYAKPTEKAVPVITALGIYDPTGENPSQVYPLTYSNYGNLFDLPEPDEATYNPDLLKGWFAINDVSEEQIANNNWQMVLQNGQHYKLCQFPYTNNLGEKVNLVGHEDAASNVCRTTEDYFWQVGNQREKPVSATFDYKIVTKNGNGKAVTYTPNEQFGERTVCSLNKTGNGHDGVGFVDGNSCRQLDGIKHNSGSIWTYKIGKGEVIAHRTEFQGVCYLNVERDNGTVEKIKLTNNRHDINQSNKYHVNLDANSQPTEVSVRCENEGQLTILDTLAITPNPAVNDLSGPVIIGQEYGYKHAESLPESWFAHTPGFNPETMRRDARGYMATLTKPNEGAKQICRFEMEMGGEMKTVHGYVEALGNNDYKCTGGSEITVRDDAGIRPLDSEINTFEWLSYYTATYKGQKIKAFKDSDEELCIIQRAGELYGAGFVNEKGHCQAQKEVHWSNGNHLYTSTAYKTLGHI